MWFQETSFVSTEQYGGEMDGGIGEDAGQIQYTQVVAKAASWSNERPVVVNISLV